MARLTKRERNPDGTGIAKFGVTTVDDSLTKAGKNILTKLADYEDLEEQGLLVRLPVSIGTKVYMIASMLDCIYDYDNCKATQKWKCEEDIQCEYERKSYYVKEIEFTSIMKNSIGKSIFIARKEAEKKLEEMKNGKK